MTDSVCFMNNGYFDIRAMLTFGVSAKINENAIGYFGTGFKYAVAIVLRHGGEVKVMTRTDDGEEEILAFTRSPETIRGETFDIVKVNGKDAGFTTRLGINWEPWMAYREFRCNCQDEKGEIAEYLEDMQKWQTVVMVKCPEIAKAHRNASHYFIEGNPIYCDQRIEIYDFSSPHTYYRGVAVRNQEESAFSYNIIEQIDLTEERMAMYTFQLTQPIEHAIRKMTDTNLIERFLTSEKEFDTGLNLDNSIAASEAFKTAGFQAVKTGTIKNESARRALKKIEESRAEYEPKTLTAIEMQMLGKAIRFLMNLGIPVTDFKIHPVISLGKGIMGRALDKKIYISELAFLMGTKQVAGTLLEEWVHLRHECPDFSRTMQNWLFDTVLSLGEQLTGKPL